MQVEASQGGNDLEDEDDTGLNSICLECNNGMVICSTKGEWGSWATSAESTHGFDAANFKQEQYHSFDNAGGSNLYMYKNSSTGYTEFQATGTTIPDFGQWRGTRYCRKGAKICAIQTKVQEKQVSGGDDVALDGVRLYCCANVVSVKVYLDALYEIEGQGGSKSSYTETRDIAVGLVSSTQIDESTSFDVAASLSLSANFGVFSGSAGLEASYAKSAFSSALNSRQQKTTKSTSWHVRFSDPLYIYQGRTVVYMSDGGTFELAGDLIQQSDSRLNASSIEALA